VTRRAVVCGGIAWNRMIHLDRFPDPVPATIFPTRTIDAVGSSGAGKAMNFASLGWDVTFWTPVGDDEAGDRAVAEVEAMGVEVVRFTDPAGTAEHVNLMDATGERISIFARSGAFELDIPVDDVCRLFDAADVISITQYDYCRPLLDPAKKTGIPVLIDIHDYDGVNPYHRQFFEAADWLFMSSVALPGWEEFARERQRAGSEIVVATHGAEGASALVDGRFHVAPAPDVSNVVDTNGAGDAFACGFVDGWLTASNPARALERASRQAGRAIAAPGLAPA
jgi:sugar/nucleoside kinase (ribokinase family)